MELKLATKADPYDKAVFYLQKPTTSEHNAVVEIVQWIREHYPELLKN